LLGWLAGVGHWSKQAQAQDKQPADAKSEGAGPKPATEHTRKANAAFARTLAFADKRDFDEAKKGLIAPLPGGGVVKNADGRVVWDPRRYDFIKLGGDAPRHREPQLLAPGATALPHRALQGDGADLPGARLRRLQHHLHRGQERCHRRGPPRIARD